MEARMAKLSSLPPRIGSAPAKIGRPPHQTTSPKRIRQEASWRAWYGTARWQRLRQEVLIREAYTCRDCGRICAGKYPAPDSPVVDHRQPHRGSERLFWEPANLQVLCYSPCHQSRKQAEEARMPTGTWD